MCGSERSALGSSAADIKQRATHVLAFETHERVGSAQTVENAAGFFNLGRELRVIVVQVRQEDVRLDRRFSKEGLLE